MDSPLIAMKINYKQLVSVDTTVRVLDLLTVLATIPPLTIACPALPRLLAQQSLAGSLSLWICRNGGEM